MKDALKSKNKSLISISSKHSIQNALDLFRDREINGAPVIDEESGIKGIVDTIDLASFICVHLRDLNSIKDILKQPVLRAVDHSVNDALILVKESESLGSLIKFMSGGLAHRCLVSKEGNAVSDIICQSDILRLLYKYFDSKVKDGSCSDFHILQLLPPQETVMIQCSTPLHLIVDLLHRRNVSCIALVNSKGQLVGNFSASDLTKLNYLKPGQIDAPVERFLSETSPLSLLSVKMDQNCSLLDILTLISEFNIHRIWIINEDNIPIRVVTMTDILKLIQSNNFPLQ